MSERKDTKSFYINADNYARLEDMKKKGKSQSDVVNKALELYFNADNYDCRELRSRNNYGLVVFRFPNALRDLLKRLRSKTKTNKDVVYTVMMLILEEFDRQHDRERAKFPKAKIVRMDYVQRILERLRK